MRRLFQKLVNGQKLSSEKENSNTKLENRFPIYSTNVLNHCKVNHRIRLNSSPF